VNSIVIVIIVIITGSSCDGGKADARDRRLNVMAGNGSD